MRIRFKNFTVTIKEGWLVEGQPFARWEYEDGRTVSGPIPVKCYDLWVAHCASGIRLSLDGRL